MIVYALLREGSLRAPGPPELIAVCASVDRAKQYVADDLKCEVNWAGYGSGWSGRDRFGSAWRFDIEEFTVL